jgi:hypothetical protein
MYKILVIKKHNNVGVDSLDNSARKELVGKIFSENTGLDVTSISLNKDGVYIISANGTIFEAEAIWDPWLEEGKQIAKPYMTFKSVEYFIWKGNKQISARVEIDPALFDKY